MAFTNIISGTIGGSGNIISADASFSSILSKFQVRYNGTGSWLECSNTNNITNKFNCSFELKLKDGETLTTMQDMFWNCSSLTSLDLSNLDTSSVTNMQSVFNNCSSLTSLNVSNFNTSQVTTMNSMFFNCSSLISLDLSSFNTSQVTNMLTMFQNCTKLTSLDLSNFNTNKVTNMNNMFFYCPVSNIILLYATSSTINSLLTLLSTSVAITIHYQQASLSDLTKQNNITYVFIEPTPIAKYKFDSSLYTDYLPVFNTEFTGYTKTDINNGDGTITRIISHDTLKPTSMRFGSYDGGITNREKSLLEVIECDTSNVTDMSNMFRGCLNLTLLNTSNFDTSNVTNMSYMFNNCTSLTSLDLSKFNTSNVTNMQAMFYSCSSLTSLNISSFDTSKVTTMKYMFQKCSLLTSLDLSNFNTSNVTNMSYMFQNCSSLTSLNLSNFDTSKVTDMRNMFDGCSSLTQLDLSNWNTSKVTNISYAFNQCSVSDIGLLYATSSTINSLLTHLGTSTARNIYYMDAPLNELTVQDNITYKKYELTMATLPYTLNKLPNGVADYIDVVNKVRVQRVGVALYSGDGMLSYGTTGADNYRFTTAPILDVNNQLWWGTTGTDFLYTHSSVRYVRGYDNCLVLYPVDKNITLANFQTVLRANPITVLYPLSTPIYTPLTEEEIAQLPLSAYKDGYINLSSDQLTPSFEFRMKASNRYQVDMLETGYYYLNAPTGNVKLGTANIDVQQMPCIVKVDNVGTGDSGYRLGFDGEITDTTQITLAKLPSHRIPTTFTQGMRCGTDFGYWEEVRCATGKELYVNETNKLDFAPIELNRIEYSNTIVEDEFDIATGKFTKRIGKYTIDGNSDLWEYSVAQLETATHMSFGCSRIPNFKKGGRCIGFLGLKIGAPNSTNSEENWSNLGVSGYLYFRFKKDRYSQYGTGADGVKAYFNANPTTIYYELEVPEISYISLPSNQVKTVANSTLLQSLRADAIYLNAQVKPSHLTYPVPSLVGNRTYTVVHNRKNITGSTKPIELNLGGTVVQLNDASSKTLVKTPSTLAHSNLIFIGGESTVDHIMVLDGDWTNKPIEYFENMKGHDTDAIITIIGDGKIDDVAEQYLW